MFALGAVFMQMLACRDAVSPEVPAPNPSTPNRFAAISISVKVTGAVFFDRLEVQVDGRSLTLLMTDVSLLVKNLDAGSHTVFLLGLPTGCVVKGLNPVTVEAWSAGMTIVEFGVDCIPPPRVDLVGTLAFVSTRDGAPHIYLASPDGSNVRQLTNQLAKEFAPAWSPDGERLAFNSDSSTFVINRNGSGLRRLRAAGRSPSWSPDGKRILVADGGVGFTIIPVDDESAPLVQIQVDEAAVKADGIWGVAESAWSPDGTRIAFSAWTDMEYLELFVMNVDGSQAHRIVEGQRQWAECGPRWSRDGKRIAVLSMMLRAAATVSVDGGELETLFAAGTSCWDSDGGGEQSQSGLGWSPDGNAMAVTMRTPSWEPGTQWPQSQRASIAIVDVASHIQLALIEDAYDPAWTR